MSSLSFTGLTLIPKLETLNLKRQGTHIGQQPTHIVFDLHVRILQQLLLALERLFRQQQHLNGFRVQGFGFRVQASEFRTWKDLRELISVKRDLISVK